MTERVLIITVGETPQVVTETVHALISAPQPWFPERILLVTTGRGAELFTQGGGPRSLAVLIGAAGRLRAMYQDLGLDDHHVEPEFVPARRMSGAVVDDIRSEVEISAFADTLLKLVREVTADPVTQLHLSLAGGRKTMSYVAGAVMSIYGRADHVLSHVLVEPAAFEGPGNFWWPGQPKAEPIVGREDGEKKLLDPDDAKVLLHPVPFIRLRAYLSDEEIFRGGMSFQDAVERANEALAIDRLVLDLEKCELRVGRFSLRLEPVRMAALVMVAQASLSDRRISQKGSGDARRPTLGGSEEDFIAIWSSYLAVLRHGKLLADDPDGFDEAFRLERRSLRTESFANCLGVPISVVRRQIKDVFPKELAERVLSRGFRTGFGRNEVTIIPHPAMARTDGTYQ
jgi:CRISPR-associated protein (TIGR02584 family)